MVLRSSGYVFAFAMLAAVLSGCGHSGIAMKGEKGVLQPSVASMVQSGELKGQAAVPGQKKEADQSSSEKKTGQAGVALKDAYFDFDRYTIRPKDADTLKYDLGWFKENPASRVRIEGHCDERGSVEYNLALGQKRADATKSFLVDLGVSGNLLEAMSYGKEKPFDRGHSEEAWANNRCAHLQQAVK